MDNRKILIGKKFKEIRKNTGITQDAFSEMIGLEPSSLSNIETGKSYPSMQTVINIIEKFNINPQEIFDYKYFESENFLEDEVLRVFRKLKHDKKQIIYRIIKCFEL